MEQRSGRDSRGEVEAVWINFQAPRQRGGRTEELLVEPVSPAPEGLGEQHAGSSRVQERREAHSGTAAGDQRTDGAEADGPHDAQAAGPDLRDLGQVRTLPVEAEVVVGVGDQHVVQPSTYDPEGDRPDADVPHHVLGTALAAPAAGGDPHGRDDADHDADGVGVDGQRAEGELRELRRRARDRGEHVGSRHGQLHHAFTVRPLSSAVSSATAFTPPSRRAATSAVPTMTPSE